MHKAGHSYTSPIWCVQISGWLFYSSLVLCATHYLTKVSTEPVSSVSPQHICTMYQIRRSFESLKNTNMSYLLVCLHKFPPREGEPLERSHGVHTPAGTQRWVGSAGGGGRDESKGEETMRNPEARGSNLMQRAHYSKMFVLRWHLSNNVVLHCVYICIVAMIL